MVAPLCAFDIFYSIDLSKKIVTWKGLHQHPITKLVIHAGARMASCHVHLLYNSSSLQEDLCVNYLSQTKHTPVQGLEAYL
jgi:hypothetical protein